MTAKNIQDFEVVPFYFSSDSTDPHDLFIKEHKVRKFDIKKPPGKTLFVLNVPPYVTVEALKDVFASAGKVQSVTFQCDDSDDTNELFGFKTAFVVFTKRPSLLRALKLERLTLPNPHNILLGMSKWIHEYNSTVYNHDKLNEEVNIYIKQHEKEEEEKKLAEKEVDDEGWTVVTKKGRNPGLSRKESVENKLIQKNKIKSKKKELKNFYTFQLKEQKMNNIIALRKSFQESKEKVNLMKKMRNFKPF
ncbi:ribosomal RNA-processing protein 7 homolog A [Tribolium castaneum]|uniref:Ribosomal RNA-processing protein 7 homolog A-like Protein n=1 Tax=Tribolium castaneum TaxID=7070 RepID=D6WGD6_TRICA|nr:PREDICTED: ribosomal RNA-processing protein 7 homolog A [Tribolium castaneum]EFA01121.1 Ribosomal RNA-processing protein 7 homolog A-like Protein [Tribolium castaneum]|eukprot:XP_971769.1 PREDICTED: ribosomal RNA-processing protein 7 homolog A [Tribolium castaneum]